MHTTDKLEWFYKEISWEAMWHTTREIDEIRDIMFDIACASSIELGLRWLHDRAEEDSNAALAEVILEKAPVVLNGLLSALAFDYAQKFLEIPRDAVIARQLRKRWKNMKRNRLKKDV